MLKLFLEFRNEMDDTKENYYPLSKWQMYKIVTPTILSNASVNRM